MTRLTWPFLAAPCIRSMTYLCGFPTTGIPSTNSSSSPGRRRPSRSAGLFSMMAPIRICHGEGSVSSSSPRIPTGAWHAVRVIEVVIGVLAARARTGSGGSEVRGQGSDSVVRGREEEVTGCHAHRHTSLLTCLRTHRLPRLVPAQHPEAEP